LAGAPAVKILPLDETGGGSETNKHADETKKPLNNENSYYCTKNHLHYCITYCKYRLTAYCSFIDKPGFTPTKIMVTRIARPQDLVEILLFKKSTAMAKQQSLLELALQGLLQKLQ
jgi:hypothetical protein